MKTKMFFVAVLLLGILFSGSRGQFSAEKMNAQINAEIIIDSIQERIKKRQIDPNSLTQKMNQDTGKYKDRTGAWATLKQEEKVNLIKQYQDEVALILRGINQERPEGVNNFFTKNERTAFLECPDQVVNAYLDSNFGKNTNDQTTVFAKARRGACANQIKTLVGDIYPTEKEFEEAIAKGQLGSLRVKILNQIIRKQKEPVFSENTNILGSNFVDPILNDAKDQLKKQGLIVTNSKGSIYIVPKGIGDFIKTEITKYQTQLKRQKQGVKIAKKVYALFPSVQIKMDKRADQIAIEQFRNAISLMRFSVVRNTLKKMIINSLSAHSEKSVSWNSFFKSFERNVTIKAIDNHVVKAPKEKQAEFRKYLGSLVFNSDKSCKDAIKALIDRTLKNEFEAVRKEISQLQFKEFFGPLEQKTWNPSWKEVDSRYNRSSSTASNVTQPLKMPGIYSKSFKSEDLLEETVDLVRQAEESAIRKGLDVLKSQMQKVEILETYMKTLVRTMANLTLEQVIKAYTDKVKKDYENLFTRTKNDIKRRSRDILDAEVKRQEVPVKVPTKPQLKDGEKKVPSNSGKEKILGGGGSGTNGGTGDGKGPGKEQEKLGDEMPDVILDFSYQGGKIYAEILFFKDRTRKGVKLQMQSDPKFNRISLLVATMIFIDWFKDLSQKTEKDEQDIDVYVLARIFNGNTVLYSMVYYFRECLISALEKVNDKRIKIHWYDKLFDEPDDVKKYRGMPILPPDFKKRSMLRLWA